VLLVAGSEVETGTEVATGTVVEAVEPISVVAVVDTSACVVVPFDSEAWPADPQPARAAIDTRTADIRM
jgi:hypothetical protein